MTDTIKIAGTIISMRSFGAGKQLATAFANLSPDQLEDGKPLTLVHQMALAFHAGYLDAKREGVRSIDLQETIRSLDTIADNLRKMHRTTG